VLSARLHGAQNSSMRNPFVDKIRRFVPIMRPETLGSNASHLRLIVNTTGVTFGSAS